MDRPYSKLEKVEIPKVFLAIPMDKDLTLHAETSAFCSYTSGMPNVEWGWTGTLSAEMSRNTLIEDHSHYTDGWTHAFFVDSDTVPPNDALQTLLSADADVIVGLTPIMLIGKGFYWSVGREGESWIPMNEDLPREPFEVVSSGASCLLVRKEVLVDIGWPFFKMEYQPKWENGGEPIKRGEDEYFCQKVRDKGYKIMADPFVVCKHFNNVDLLEALKLAKKLFEK